MNPTKKLTLALLALCVLLPPGGSSVAQQTQGSYSLPADQIIPGRPWTSIIPDPDKFSWSTRDGGRPGYRYRGMLPMQQKFYEYIQQKRQANTPLSSAEQSTIRWLITSRRWPEAPRPNAFWAAFMRYLRQQPTTDLNVAQGIMVDQLLSRGLVPVDMPPNQNFQRVRDYLNSGPFRSRNWFERVFGRVEPWMDNLYAGYGFDMRPSAPSGNSFPGGDPFNGLKVTYNISGASLSPPLDKEGFTISRGYTGVLGTGTLTVSGTYRVGGYGADVTLSVWAGDKKDEKKVYTENTGSSGNPQNFSLSVPIPAGARTGGFAIRLDGRYSMGGGHRGCYVTGEFGPSAEQIAADKAAADAKWRQEVEDTLKRLGHENTPEGKEIEEMRKALAGGDASWKAFVDKRLDQMRGDTSPEVVQFNELEGAMNAGGAEWEQYVAAHGKTGSADASTGTLIKTGQNSYDSGKYADAVDAFTRAIQANPNSAEAYAGRGLAKRGLNDNSGAMADVTRALELDPKNADAYRGRSMIKRGQNDYQGALSDADRSVQLAPNNYRAYLTRGLAKNGLNDLNGALADYTRAIELNPAYASSYLYRGNALLSLKDNRGALADLNHFIATNQSNSSAYNNRGLAKERLGDIQGAMADYEKSISLNPNDDTAKKNLARVRTGGDKSSGATAGVIFNNGNIGGVANGPTQATAFTINQAHFITTIENYHWNNGRGARGGTIALRSSNGTVYGPWAVTTSGGQGGAPNVGWSCSPNVVIPPGTYTVIDSDPATWSHNPESGARGFSKVIGYSASSDRISEIKTQPTPQPTPTTRATAGEVTAIFENKSLENVHIFVDGETFGPGNRLAPGETRRVVVRVPANGRIKFYAGRNGQLIATKSWDGDPEHLDRYPRVAFSNSGQLLVITGLR